MPIIQILQYPNPRLKQKGEDVTEFNQNLQKIIDDMFETHYAAKNCAALAATQLDFKEPKNITVIDFSEKKNEPLCLVNPKITSASGEQFEEEGCMSVGANNNNGKNCLYAKVKRAYEITVSAQDSHGKPLNLTATGFLAKCIQHEVDHLKGITFFRRAERYHLAKAKKDKKMQERYRKRQKTDT